MLSLIFCLVVVTWLSIPCYALPGILALRTAGGDYGSSTAACTPGPTPFVDHGQKRDLSPGANSSTSVPAVPTSAATPLTCNGTNNTGRIAGIAVAGALIVLVLVGSAGCPNKGRWCRSRRNPNLQIRPEPARESKVPTSQVPIASSVATTSQVPVASSVSTFFALPHGTLRFDQALTNFKDGSIEYRFMALLTLFGSNGVPLRELIMLASLRTSTKTSHNHWLIDGERGPLRDAIDAETMCGKCSFLAAFVHETSTTKSIETFQERLVSLGLVYIEYQDLSETLSSAQKCWFMDGRIWRYNQSNLYALSLKPELLLEVFLEVFTEMPCKDISPLAERQREIHYSHAHEAIACLYRKRVLPHVHRRAMRQVVLVILQILSHRFLKEDEALLRFAKENLPKCGLHSDWNMILLVAELKATILTNYENLSQLKDKVFQVVEGPATRGDSSPRAKGLSWWLLVELLDAAEAQDCVELIDAVVQDGKQWMRRLLGSELSSLEQTMLCRAFARFGTSDHPEPQPRQYQLLFGYQLSRAGYIEKAEELLLASLEFYASSPISTRLWSYRFELVSLMLRAGRWSEAEAWLASARMSAVTRSQVMHETDFWKRSGECGETFILLGLYQADCNMAMGKLRAAEGHLRDTIERTLFVRDPYIRALRLALRTRLLNVQIWQEIWERATVTAQDLIEDIIASEHCLYTTPSSGSVVVTVLTLINKLLWVNDVLGADRLLKSVKRFEAADYPVLPSNIKLYLERRRAAVSHLLSVESSPEYIQHLGDSGADAEVATTVAPVHDLPSREPPAEPSRAQRPTSEISNTQATKAVPSHPGPNPVKLSSAYKWSSELENARFPTPEVEQLVDLEIRSHEAKVLDARDKVRPQTAKRGAKRVRILRRGTRRGAMHNGNPLAEKLARAPRPPTHEPGKPKSPTYNYPTELEPDFRQPTPAELLSVERAPNASRCRPPLV
ncbi:hypothetical protein JMJ35_008817 [Cladonia borealis]|uniref:Uncharacterized protein n=1 Tax=Cladonia borealis TaxID=184061 RepID=A0AA39U629_9LECA|nr:hypothetical protein JMJ35_008817 [Cladonia borealis]